MSFSSFKNSSNVLSQKEMSNVKGGGTCGYTDGYGGVRCGVSKSEATFMGEGGHWCCDSCATSSYCGK